MELIDLISQDLTQMVNYPTLIANYDSHISALLHVFLPSGASISFTMTLPSLGNSIMLLSQFPLTFHQTQQDAMFQFIAFVVIGMVFVIV